MIINGTYSKTFTYIFYYLSKRLLNMEVFNPEETTEKEIYDTS